MSVRKRRVLSAVQWVCVAVAGTGFGWTLGGHLDLMTLAGAVAGAAWFALEHARAAGVSS